MKKFINSLFSFTLFSIFLTSCVDKVDVTVSEGESLLVVDGWITNQAGPYTVKLSTTGPYFNNEQTARVQGASLMIVDSEGVKDTLREVSPGEYKTSTILGKIGNSYTLFIDALGESYMATTEIKRVPPIDSLSYEYVDNKGTDRDGYFLRYYGPEPAGVGDNYRFLLTRNDTLLNKPGDVWRITSDEFVDGNYINAWDPYEGKLKKGDKMKIEGLSLTRDAYLFFTEMAIQVTNGGMFSNPPANVRTNIINVKGPSGKKAVGYFGGSAVSTNEVVIE